MNSKCLLRVKMRQVKALVGLIGTHAALAQPSRPNLFTFFFFLDSNAKNVKRNKCFLQGRSRNTSTCDARALPLLRLDEPPKERTSPAFRKQMELLMLQSAALRMRSQALASTASGRQSVRLSGRIGLVSQTHVHKYKRQLRSERLTPL